MENYTSDYVNENYKLTQRKVHQTGWQQSG